MNYTHPKVKVKKITFLRTSFFLWWLIYLSEKSTHFLLAQLSSPWEDVTDSTELIVTLHLLRPGRSSPSGKLWCSSSGVLFFNAVQFWFHTGASPTGQAAAAVCTRRERARMSRWIQRINKSLIGQESHRNGALLDRMYENITNMFTESYSHTLNHTVVLKIVFWLYNMWVCESSRPLCLLHLIFDMFSYCEWAPSKQLGFIIW